MPPPLPDRFKLEIRLGRDDDIEEWLATDRSLDRPVLIRFLGPESTPVRRRQFVAAVGQASAVSHPHLASVFLAEAIPDGAFSVSEWTGGATLAARLSAGDTVDPEEFLPNAAGLAAALAALHDQGVVHGGIDPAAITYTVAHPAKLGAFGRRSTGWSVQEDVRALADTLEQSLTGGPPGGSPPSESIDGMSPAVDRVLREGRRGSMNAHALSEAFAGAPTPRRPQPESSRPSRRLLLVAIGLLAAAATLVGVGRIFTPSTAPISPPGADVEITTTTVAIEPTTTTAVATGRSPVTASNPATLDPFGGGGENDDLLDALLDGDPTTTWRTERYLDPLPLVKPGVGVTIDVAGVPGSVELHGLTPDTSFELRWARSRGPEPDDFDLIARAVSHPGTTSIQLPSRSNGTWLIWLTDLPPSGADYLASVSMIRFLP
ncbi:protein kinase family protein [soil metagenome]